MNFLLVVLAYVLCHGLTAMVVTPIQSVFLPEMTVFASLIYLPRCQGPCDMGVRLESHTRADLGGKPLCPAI